MHKILIINGPNLNLLGQRENQVYGNLTLAQIKELTKKRLAEYQVELDWFQSNIEGEIVERIHQADEKLRGIIINPAAYSHTSVAIYDALKAKKIDSIEVHLSNVHARESFREVLLTAKASRGIISGLAEKVYYLAALSLLED